jgi:hypothetical protein
MQKQLVTQLIASSILVTTGIMQGACYSSQRVLQGSTYMVGDSSMSCAAASQC